MKTRLIINFLLAITVICLGIVAWLKPGQEQAETVRLSTLDITSINHITIERGSEDTIKLKKADGQWALTHPINAPALSEKIERLLKISQIEPPTTYPLEPESLQRFGLKQPIASIQFNNDTFSIGKTESVHTRRYVSKGKQLFLLYDTFLHHLTAPLGSYIDTRLLPDGAQIIDIQAPGIHLQQQADNTWKNTLSPTDILSSDAVQMLFDEWRFARAIKVSSQTPRETTDKIMITLDTNQIITFGLIRQHHDVFLISADKKLTYTFSLAKYQQMINLATPPPADA